MSNATMVGVEDGKTKSAALGDDAAFGDETKVCVSHSKIIIKRDVIDDPKSTTRIDPGEVL